MVTGKVVKRFRDKLTRKRFEAGDTYSHKDEKRLQELAELGFVKYKGSEKKVDPKQEEDSPESR